MVKFLPLIPLLPLAGFLFNAGLALVATRRKKAPAEWLPSLIGCLAPFLSFVLSVGAFWVLRQNPHEPLITGPLFSWFSTSLLSVDFGFLVDPLSSVMILIVTGVGTLIHIYSIGYMKGDQGFARYFSYLNLFLFFMLLLVMGDNLLVLFVGWEGVGLCSYLLIGFWFTDAEKAAAGFKAFVVNRIGDFGFLIGLFLILFAFLSQSQGSENSYLNYSFMENHKEIFAPLATVITLCLFAGATGKSAQIPLYVWLPDAMAGPTPVSALIHAATMVTAGIYMVARLFFLFEMAPVTLSIIGSIGLATALMAALIGLTQYDIKKVLAYSTVSQLGYMFLALGMGAPVAAIFHLMTHAFFKACLFLGAGSVIHALHDQDIRNMGGLFSKMKYTGITFLVATLAIAGIPPLSGFFSKDEILLMTYVNGSPVFYILSVLTAGLTAFYMFRLFVTTFLGKTRHPHPDHIHESSLVMVYPLKILAFLSIVGGLVGLPHVLGGENRIHHWLGYLKEATEVPHQLELRLMVISTVWCLFMSGLAFYLYCCHPGWTKRLKQKGALIYSFIFNKFKIDELYQAVIIKPLLFISTTLLWKGSDQKIVDGILVHGWTKVATVSARLLSLLQTGVLGHYLLFLWGGLIVFLFLAVR